MAGCSAVPALGARPTRNQPGNLNRHATVCVAMGLSPVEATHQLPELLSSGGLLGACHVALGSSELGPARGCRSFGGSSSHLFFDLCFSAAQYRREGPRDVDLGHRLRVGGCGDFSDTQKPRRIRVARGFLTSSQRWTSLPGLHSCHPYSALHISRHCILRFSFAGPLIAPGGGGTRASGLPCRAS